METNDLGEDDDVTDIPKITIGLCAMNKKTRSRPMKEIVTRIVSLGFFDVKIFTDEVILKEPIEKWPLCDCLISFFSSGFPLEKAIAYADLRKPFLLNDLKFQFDLQDRCKVYSLLKSAGIETPRYAILRRDEDGNVIGPDLIETEDSVQIGDTVFYKPFVEKPLDAEDHSVCIYYPTSAGGGSQRLFRKVGSRSSVYSRQSCVRRTGSYIYEDFVPTDGTDVKVYTVGPEYAHAEARKSPSLDGKVERDSQGKEIRYPVILNQYEKEIANKVCTVFKQSVCGFDLLRTRGKSYVCDVNGFSFVKTSRKYYDDCAMVISSMILLELAPQLYMPYDPDYVIEDMPPEEGECNEDSKLELLCVVGIIRHGDRTPKQKLKMEVRHPRFIELFRNYGGSNEHDLKLKKPKEMQEVLDIARDLLQAIKNGEQLFENRKKLHQIKSVLEMYGYFSGINRKVQLKYLGRVSSGVELQEESQSRDSNRRKESGEIALLLILKWGGELTSMGRAQAEELGETYRWMYTESQDEYTGGGLLRLHSTYRHDLKIYASDEGRVQMTAAAFAKGFLALEGELTPILVHLVRTDKNVTQMLDTSVDAARIMAKVKHHLHEIMQKDEEFKKEDFNELAPTQSRALVNAMKKVRNPHQMCEKLYSLVQALTTQLKEMINDKVIDPKKPYLYHGESLELMTHRWTKLEKDFKLKTGDFDISLIPDLYDCIKYDVQHNRNLGLKNTMELYNCAKSLADIVIPQEYGITKEEKLDISERVCFRLLRKFHGDLKHADKLESTTRLDPKYSRDVGSPHRHVRTRLYFTSESHIHTVTNALRCAKLFDDVPDSQWQRAVNYLEEVSELNYMTQIVFMLYEDPTMDPNSGQKFHLKLHFSSGARTIDDPHYVGSPVKALGDISEDFDPWILSPWGEFVKGPKEDNTAAEEKEAITSSDHSSQNGRINGNTTALMQKNPKACNRNSHETGIDGKFASTSSFCSDDSLYQLIHSPNSFTNSLSSLEHFEENVDKPFDENLFGFNEQPRCSIGENMEEYIDSGSEMAPGLGMDDQKHLEGSPRKTCDGSTFKSEISEIKASHTDDSRLFAKSNASIMQQLKQAKLTNFRRTRSKSEGDVLGFFSTRKDEEYQLLREATNFLQDSWNVKEDSSNGTVESTKISESRNLREVANEETKDYFELLQSYTLTRPRRGSEDGPKFEEEVMELMKSKRFKSWPNALSNEEREKGFLAHHKSSQAEDKTRAESPSQSSKPSKGNFSSSNEIKSVQEVRETQSSQPERHLELKHEDDSPPAAPTEKETENGMKESCAPSVKTTEQDLVLSGRTKSALHLQGKQYPQPRVLRTKWSIGGTPITAKTDETISQQMQALQLSPPQGKLRSRWSAGGPPCAAVLSTLQAVRKKSYGVRKISKSRPPPGCFTIPEEKGSPPVSDFWRLIESINPLLVLHDSIPLKQMDKFLETLSKHSPKNTPHSSPHRNKRTKHLLSK